MYKFYQNIVSLFVITLLLPFVLTIAVSQLIMHGIVSIISLTIIDFDKYNIDNEWKIITKINEIVNVILGDGKYY